MNWCDSFRGQAHSLPFYSKFNQLASSTWKQTIKPKTLLDPTEFPPYPALPNPRLLQLNVLKAFTRLSASSHPPAPPRHGVSWPLLSTAPTLLPTSQVTNMLWIQGSHVSPYLTWPLLSARMWDSVYHSLLQTCLPWLPRPHIFLIFFIPLWSLGLTSSSYSGHLLKADVLRCLKLLLTLFILLNKWPLFLGFSTIYQLMTLSLYFSPTSLL